MIAAAAFVLLWFTIAFSLSVTGVLELLPSPALVGTGWAVPAAGFTTMYWLSGSFRRFVRTSGLRILTFGQNLRFYGVLAFFAARDQILPPLFAIPTGIIDVVIAGTSFVVARRLVTPQGPTRRDFITWHLIGLAGLAVSITLGILTSSPAFRLVHDGITTQPMRRFPISLVPIFIGPMVLAFHVLAIVGARWRERRSAH